MKTAQLLHEEVNSQTDYVFNTDQITYTSVGLKGDKQSYVTGYISVPEIDLYNDLITPTALKSMLRQITEKTITLDYEHEAFRDDNTILPVGKIIEAKVDERGLWVKCKLNSHSPKYKALWGSIQDGMVNAFSIAFKPLKTVEKSIGDTQVRLIEDLVLLNVALTATPVCESAKMTGHSMKSIMLKAIADTQEEKVLVTKSFLTKFMEEKNMEETETTETVETPTEEVETTEAPAEAEAPVEEKTEEAEETPAEAPAEAPAEEPAEAPAEAPAEETVESKALADLKAKVEAQSKELRAIKETNVFKSTVSDKPALKAEKVDMLNLIG